MCDDIEQHTAEANKKGTGFLIYSSYVGNGINLVKEELDSRGIAYVCIDGTTTPKGRKEAVKAMNSGEIKVMLISRAGGEGVNLLRVNRVYLLNPNWNDAQDIQAEGRALRRDALTFLGNAERVVDILRIEVVLDDGMPTGDEMVASIAARKAPINTDFVERLRKRCDPLRQYMENGEVQPAEPAQPRRGWFGASSGPVLHGRTGSEEYIRERIATWDRLAKNAQTPFARRNREEHRDKFVAQLQELLASKSAEGQDAAPKQADSWERDAARIERRRKYAQEIKEEEDVIVVD